MVTPCPICAAPAVDRYPGSPYWVCPSCACWFQWPQPAKAWHAAHEHPTVMDESERAINRELARSLHRQYLAIFSLTRPRTLDIGAALPVLASAFHDLGCDAHAIDGEVVNAPNGSLPVQVERMDFERLLITESEPPPEQAPHGALQRGGFDLVTMIHTFEHCYDPLEALRRLHALLAVNGRAFLRMPDHEVPGFERDLTPGHFGIHPFYHCLDSVLEGLRQTRTFTVLQTYPLPPGQRDYILTPL